MSKKNITHLVIPDTQVKPGVPTDHLEWCGNYIAEKKPDSIIQLGDFSDMESLCSYDEGKKAFEGRRYKNDVRASREAMARLIKPWAKIRGYTPRRILLLGNHEDRIRRAVEIEARLEGMLDVADLGYAEAGWEVQPFLEPKKINGVMYSHYFVSGLMDRAVTSARALLNKFHQSCVAGHQQGRDIAYAKNAEGHPITAIIAGSFYQHDEEYMSHMSNKCWRGFYVLHEVNRGSFDEMAVSLDYLKRKYS